MRIGNINFSPSLKITLITAIVFSILLSLGFWQLRRVDEKLSILAEQERKQVMPIHLLTGNEKEVEDLLFRKVSLRGKFVPAYTVFLDNKIINGDVGYNHVVLFHIENSNYYVFINRGWVSSTGDRNRLPELEIERGSLTISGQIKIETKDVASFGSGNRVKENWPAVLRWLDIGVLELEIGMLNKPLDTVMRWLNVGAQQSMSEIIIMPLVVLEEPDVNSTYVRKWQFISSTPEKSMSYAVQWFTMSLALLIIFVVVNSKRIKEI